MKVTVRITLISIALLVTGVVAEEYRYQPSLTVGGARYFREVSEYASSYNLWLPLHQIGVNKLIYSDLRLFGRSGSSMEGNGHLGYRQLSRSQKSLWGIYGAYDYRRSYLKNYYHQLTLGGEFWYKKWFLGGNVYLPIGKKRYLLKEGQQEIFYPYGTLITRIYEVAQKGVDGELGYGCSDRLTGYLGGYRFSGQGAKHRMGVKGRLTYEYLPKRAWWGVIKQISFEGGIQYDRIKRTTGYIGISLRFGLGKTKESKAEGVMRHMSDLVRRDPDIVVEKKMKTDFSPNLGELSLGANWDWYANWVEEIWAEDWREWEEDEDTVGAEYPPMSLTIKGFGPENLAKQCEKAYEFLREGEVQSFQDLILGVSDDSKNLGGNIPDHFKRCQFTTDRDREVNLLGLSVQFWRNSRLCMKNMKNSDALLNSCTKQCGSQRSQKKCESDCRVTYCNEQFDKYKQMAYFLNEQQFNCANLSQLCIVMKLLHFAVYNDIWEFSEGEDAKEDSIRRKEKSALQGLCLGLSKYYVSTVFSSENSEIKFNKRLKAIAQWSPKTNKMDKKNIEKMVKEILLFHSTDIFYGLSIRGGDLTSILNYKDRYPQVDLDLSLTSKDLVEEYVVVSNIEQIKYLYEEGYLKDKVMLLEMHYRKGMGGHAIVVDFKNKIFYDPAKASPILFGQAKEIWNKLQFKLYPVMTIGIYDYLSNTGLKLAECKRDLYSIPSTLSSDNNAILPWIIKSKTPRVFVEQLFSKINDEQEILSQLGRVLSNMKGWSTYSNLEYFFEKYDKGGKLIDQVIQQKIDMLEKRGKTENLSDVDIQQRLIEKTISHSDPRVFFKWLDALNKRGELSIDLLIESVNKARNFSEISNNALYSRIKENIKNKTELEDMINDNLGRKREISGEKEEVNVDL